jgi:hypothetical protein
MAGMDANQTSGAATLIGTLSSTVITLQGAAMKAERSGLVDAAYDIDVAVTLLKQLRRQLTERLEDASVSAESE